MGEVEVGRIYSGVDGVRRSARWVLLALALAASACSTADSSADVDEQGDGASRAEVTVSLGPDAGSSEVADGFEVAWDSGVFGAGAELRVAGTPLPQELPVWFTAADKPIDISIEPEPPNPLTLTWDPPTDPPEADSLPVVLHWEAETSEWQVVAVGDGDVAMGTSSRFSPHVPGWLSPSRVLGNIREAIGEAIGKRTEDIGCGGGPDWAELGPPAIDVVRTCLTTNPADGVDRAEVQLKNNRGYLLEVEIPSGVAYAHVDGQTEPIRNAVRAFTGRDSVLLSPGQLMTIGFTRPAQGRVIAIHAAPTVHAAIAHVLVEAIGDLNGLAAVAKALADCGVGPSLPFSTVPTVNSVGDAGTAAISCFGSLFADPSRATQFALEVIGMRAGVDAVAAASDRMLATAAATLAGRVRKAAVVIKGLEVFTSAADYAIDAYTNSSNGDYTGMTTQLSLRPMKKEPALWFDPLPFRPIDVAARDLPRLGDMLVRLLPDEPWIRPYCTSLIVTGWNPDSDSVDVFIEGDPLAVDAYGEECGGDGHSRFLAIRGNQILAQLLVCACELEFDRAEYSQVRDHFKGRPVVRVSVGFVEGDWYLESATTGHL